MDYLQKIKKLFEFEEIANKRVDQLKQEEKVDERLIQCYNTCPDQVFAYVMNMRKLNRKHAYSIHETGILEYPEKMEKAYTDIRDVQKNFWWKIPYDFPRSFSEVNRKDAKTCCSNYLPEANELLEKMLKK
jgi:hypothetical protein